MTKGWTPPQIYMIVLLALNSCLISLNGWLLSQEHRQRKELVEIQQRVQADIAIMNKLLSHVPGSTGGVIPHNSIFHAPADGCPKGTTLRMDLLERDGVPVAACENPHGDGSLDYIMPGEGFKLTFPIPSGNPEELGKPEEPNQRKAEGRI